MPKKKDKPAVPGLKNPPPPPPPKEPKKVGRPTLYSEKIVAEICERLMIGESLRAICRDEAIPALSIVCKWLADPEKKEFTEQYTRARKIQAEIMIDEIIEIADDSSGDTIHTEFGPKENKEYVNRSKLRVESRKWVAVKLLPKVYGDKLDITSKDEKINNGLDLSKLSEEQLRLLKESFGE